MDSTIQKFIDVLADNDYRAKYKEIPDDVDNRDEIIAELQTILDDDGLLPDSLRFFELNGKASSSELALYLNKSFQQFKNEFLAEKHDDNELYKNELLKQIAEIKKEIEQIFYESKQLKDETLTQMFEAKAKMCDEASKFILSHQDKNIDELSGKEPQIKRSFKWLKEKGLLTHFFNILKLNELIAMDTDINDFMAVFSNIPISDIKKPVQWEKGAKLFAYFFHNLITRNFIPQKPSWINLQYCFTYNRNDIGQYVPIEEGVKAHVTVFNKEGAPKGAELIDELFNIDGKQDK